MIPHVLRPEGAPHTAGALHLTIASIRSKPLVLTRGKSAGNLCVALCELPRESGIGDGP